MDIATVLNTANIKMTSFNAHDVGDGLSIASVVLEVRNYEELRLVMGKLSAVKGVTKVTRSDR